MSSRWSVSFAGYLYGSSWKEYAAGGGPTTEHLPPGLKMADRLPEPIFTPATKAASGHDENLTEQDAREFVGTEMYELLRSLSLDIYSKGSQYAAERNILLADTKFEFGVIGDDVILIDEVLTPDSSRYWPADRWVPGEPVPSYDKQPVRIGWKNNRGTRLPLHLRCPPPWSTTRDGGTSKSSNSSRVPHSWSIPDREIPRVYPSQGRPVRPGRRRDGSGAWGPRYDEVGTVHFGRTIELEIGGDDNEAATARVAEMCRRLLANPVIEDFTIEEIH